MLVSRKKIILLFVCLCATIPVFSQYFDYNQYSSLLQNDPKRSYQIGGNTNGFIASDALNQNFALSLVTSGNLSNQTIASSRLQENNYLSGDFNSCFFANIMDNNTGFRIAASTRSFIDAGFSKDAYDLLFYGNNMFEGQTADLSNLQLHIISYWKLQLGLIKRVELPGGCFTGFLGLSLIDGMNNTNINFPLLTVTTGMGGEYIDINSKFTYKGSDSTQSKISDLNGIGAAADIFLAYEGKAPGITITFTASDIGFIHWRKHYIEANMDTSYQFDVLNINILNPGQVQSPGLSQDTLKKILYAHSHQTTATVLLPGIISFNISKRISKLFEVGLGSDYIIQTHAKIPMTYVNLKYHILKVLTLTGNVGYGYYNNANVGLGVNMNLFKYLYLRVGSNNLFGFLYANNSFSQQYYAGAYMKF